MRAARPDLTPDQVSQAVRLSAVDLAPAGWDRTPASACSVARALTIKPPPADRLSPTTTSSGSTGARSASRTGCSTAGTGHRRLQGLSTRSRTRRTSTGSASARTRASGSPPTRPATTTSRCTSTGARPSGCSQKPYKKASHKRRGKTRAHHAPQLRQAREDVLRGDRGPARRAATSTRATRCAWAEPPPAGAHCSSARSPVPRGRRASGPRGCRAGTTRRPARPGSPSRRR